MTTSVPDEMTVSVPTAPIAFYVTGGTLGADAASYVERRADRDLLGSLIAGDYCYVLNSRQMGKSSLCVRTMQRLKQQGWRTCFLDLTKFGGKNLSAEQWYAALLFEVGRELGLRAEMMAFWKQNMDLGPMQRFFGAIQQVALPADASPLAVFVDEIDVTRGLPFSADEFFAGVRQCYVGRASDPALSRLAFCLLGTATPADLIQDTRTSPFNIGRRIEVNDFTPEEAVPLAAGLGAGGAALLARVLYWTGGNPYLTQRLCRAAQEAGVQAPADINRLCSDLFLTRKAAEGDDNLAFVRNRLLKSEVDLAGLLDLYRQMRRGQRVPDDEADPLCAILKLSGVARTDGGLLRIRNRIYEHVFSRAWVVEHTPGAELRRQREAYRRGLARARLPPASSWSSPCWPRRPFGAPALLAAPPPMPITRSRSPKPAPYRPRRKRRSPRSGHWTPSSRRNLPSSKGRWPSSRKKPLTSSGSGPRSRAGLPSSKSSGQTKAPVRARLSPSRSKTTSKPPSPPEPTPWGKNSGQTTAPTRVKRWPPNARSPSPKPTETCTRRTWA